MAGSTYNREQYKVAIPQLDAKMNEILDNNVIIERQVVTINQTVEKVDDDFQYYKNLTTGYFTAIAGNVEYLASREAYLQHLNTDIASIGYIDAGAIAARYANLTDFNAVSGEVNNLKVGNLTIGGVTVNIYDLALAIKQSSMASETIWYKASATAPTSPTTYDPTADGWSMTEPVYTGDTTTHLYSCLRVVYADHTADDPHFVWSDIHLIQSWDAAKAAYSYAETANTAATGALNGLATVEDVVGTLNWIAEHGEYVLTEDTEVKSGKQYYLYGYEPSVFPYPYGDTTKESNGISFTDNGDGTITASGTATANADFGIKRQNVQPYLFLDDGRTYHLSGCPEGGSAESYYMFVNHTGTGGAVIYGNDTGEGFDFEAIGEERVGAWIRIVSGTTVNNLTFSPNLSAQPVPVENPTGNPSAQGWYELSIDEAVSNYIATHLALTGDGLFLTMDENGYKLKLTSQGAYIVDPTWATIAEYSDQTIIGDARFRNVFIDSDSVDIRLATEVLASFGETVLIGKSNAQRVEMKNDATKFFDAAGALTAEIAQGQTTGVKFVEQNIALGTVLDDTNGVSFELSAVPKGDNGHGLVVDVNVCNDHARIWFESWTEGQVKTLSSNNITAVLDSSENTVKLTHSGTKQSIARKETSQAGSSFTHTLEHAPASNSTATITLRSTEYGSVWYRFRNVDLTQDVSDYYGQFRFTYSASTRTFTAVNDQGTSCYIEIDYVAEASVIGADSYIRFSIVGVAPNYTFGNRTEMDANQSPYARGVRSFAAGFGLVAESENQAVFGQYNDNDSNNLLEIGNGASDSSRSNAFAVDWSGNIELNRAKVNTLSASGNITSGGDITASGQVTCSTGAKLSECLTDTELTALETALGL